MIGTLDMKLKQFMMTIVLICLFASSFANAASKAEIDTDVQFALTAFYNLSPGNKELASKASGVLIFPSVMKAGFFVGGDYGEGALQVEGKTVDYYSTAAISFGLQLGAQSRSEVILFMDKNALESFRLHDGWAAGLDGSVAVIDNGAGKGVSTETASAPIIAFIFSNKGLMGNLSVEGSKFSKIYR
jgi:lipid-binding SYLF domain-containing protein